MTLFVYTMFLMTFVFFQLITSSSIMPWLGSTVPWDLPAPASSFEPLARCLRLNPQLGVSFGKNMHVINP